MITIVLFCKVTSFDVVLLCNVVMSGMSAVRPRDHPVVI
ncbi:hypothetical protein NSERUTF1_5233 [Nocardia seriolae]|nr:hypothetical protein NSERUTF1_5233 [Nocardia seriolae]